MRMLSGIAAIGLLGVGSMAFAGEPVRLEAAALDSVTAGAWSGFALAFNGPARARGAAISATQLSAVETLEVVVVTPTSFAGDFRAAGIAQTSVRAIGLGTTSASGSSGVYTGVSTN